MMNNIVVAPQGCKKKICAAWLWEYGNFLHKGLQPALNSFGLALVVGMFFCGYSYAEQTSPSSEKKEKLISITLGEVTFKLPSPVHLDGKWVDHNAKGTELSFSIRAADLYQRFDLAAKNNPDLLRDRFEVYLIYVEGSDVNKRKSNLLRYMKDSKWDKIYPDLALGLLVYEPPPRLAQGWGSPVYYSLDEKYVTSDGLPFKISCNRIYGNSMPVGCRFNYFVSANISMTFNFARVEKNLKYWREIDQALRQTLNAYMDN